MPRTENAGWQEDWGEQYTGKRPPAVFVLDLRDWSVRSVKGFPQDSSMGQPAISPDGEPPGCRSAWSLGQGRVHVRGCAVRCQHCESAKMQISGLLASSRLWCMEIVKGSCGSCAGVHKIRRQPSHAGNTASHGALCLHSAHNGLCPACPHPAPQPAWLRHLRVPHASVPLAWEAGLGRSAAA